MVGKSVRHGFRSFSQLKRAAVLIVICGAALGPWVARNLFQAGYAGFSSFASDSVYFFAAPEIVARTEGISAEAARQRFQQADAEFARSHPHATPGDMVRFRSDSSGRVIHEHPLLYARLHLAGAAGYFLPGATEVLEVAGMTHGQQGTLDVLHKNGVVAAIRHYFGGNYAAMALAAPIAAFELAVFVGAVMLAVRRLVSRKKVRPYLFVLWLLVTMVIISPLLSGPFGLPRYRLPMTPLWILAAAAGWLGLQKRRAADDAKKAGS